MLKAGDKAPDFTLPDTNMELTSLSDFRGSVVVLYFYPKDDTPGCTVEATEFSDMLDSFRQAGAEVIGVSRDDCFSHQAFTEKFGLLIRLLADVDSEAAEKYGVLQDKEGGNRKSMIRSTFVIDRDGVIQFVEYGVQPKGHAAKILSLVHELQDR